MSFDRVTRETAVQSCVRSIRKEILAGRLRPGQTLPPERDLAGRLGTSRPTLRTALAQLTAARLIEVRQGSAYTVCDYRLGGGPELLAGLAISARDDHRIEQIAEELLFVRRLLAEAVLRRLSTRASFDRQPIADAVAAFAEAVQDGQPTGALAQADVAIVAAILEATDSPVLRLFINPVAAAVAELPSLADAIYATPRDNVIGYELLLAWLDNPRAELVEPIVRELESRDLRTIERLSAMETP
jgi:GntR family transcriptional repressor for pyruvate dehydrogenase complex